MVTVGLLGDIVLLRPIGREDQVPTVRTFCSPAADPTWVVGNLEVPMTDVENPQPWGLRSLRAPAERVSDLSALGIDAVSLANNHSSDQGWAGLQATVTACAASGIDTAGVGSDRTESLNATIVVPERWSEGRSEHSLALIGVSCIGHPDMFAGAGPGIASLVITTDYKVDDERVHEQPGWPARVVTVADPASLTEVTEAVRRARLFTPVVVVSMHWGVTLQEDLADYQRDVARALAEAGATVVFGHQSHVLQATEWIGSTPVFYGLGSFVFHYEGDIAAKVPDDTAVGLVDIDPETGRATGARLLMGRLGSGGEPQFGDASDGAAAAERVMRLSHGLEGWREHDGGSVIIVAPGAPPVSDQVSE